MRLARRVAARVYGLIVSLRAALYEQGVLRSYRSTLPVISVGNVTAGGNGKTPLCIFLAQELAARGYRPAVLSRGYGGLIRGPHRVSLTDAPVDVGDEPLLMAQSGVPMFIARSRVRGVQLIEQLGESDIVILDDGLQHRALHRDVEIVSIFAGTEKAIVDFVRGELLPLGMFREKRERAIARASMVIVAKRAVVKPSEAQEIDLRIRRLIPQTVKVFSSALQADGVRLLSCSAPISPQPVHVCTAIANPDGFLLSLEHLGYPVDKRFLFADHHLFSTEEVTDLVRQYPDRLFVCTAKDAVKLREFPSEVCQRFAVLNVRAFVEPRIEFFAELERLVQVRRGQRKPDEL